jgi:hypothetical protein
MSFQKGFSLTIPKLARGDNLPPLSELSAKFQAPDIWQIKTINYPINYWYSGAVIRIFSGSIGRISRYADGNPSIQLKR